MFNYLDIKCIVPTTAETFPAHITLFLARDQTELYKSDFTFFHLPIGSWDSQLFENNKFYFWLDNQQQVEDGKLVVMCNYGNQIIYQANITDTAIICEYNRFVWSSIDTNSVLRARIHITNRSHPNFCITKTVSNIFSKHFLFLSQNVVRSICASLPRMLS